MRRFACASVTIFFVVSTISPSSARAESMVVLTPPVVAPVLDPFRLPVGPYGPGNRGLEYDTAVGQAVVAAAGGTVVFAGAVAGTLHVTIDHGGGLLSSYSFLDRIVVTRGDVVARGDRVGVAGETFHLGVRVFGEYVDPALMMGSVVVHVRLVANRPRGDVATGASMAPFAVPPAEADVRAVEALSRLAPH